MYIMCTKCKMSPSTRSQLQMSKTVKAREHYGANSLDLTIPADVVKEHDVNPGDIFEIVINSEDGELVLTYKRVYQD